MSLQLKAAKLEIRDLQAEFEVERNDYLATIRRQEREGQLLHSLLERMVPLVRRDCNYSNLDRLKKEAAWDEDSASWRLPDVTVQKTTLPSGSTCEDDFQSCLSVFSHSVACEPVCVLHVCFLLDIIPLLSSLTAVAPKLSARTGLASEPGERLTVRLCVTHLLPTNTH